MTYKFSAIIEKEDKWFVALCPELDVASQGKTIERALANLREAVQLYVESASRKEVQAALSATPLLTTFEIAV